MHAATGSKRAELNTVAKMERMVLMVTGYSFVSPIVGIFNVQSGTFFPSVTLTTMMTPIRDSKAKAKPKNSNSQYLSAAFSNRSCHVTADS